MTEKDMHT